MRIYGCGRLLNDDTVNKYHTDTTQIPHRYPSNKYSEAHAPYGIRAFHAEAYAPYGVRAFHVEAHAPYGVRASHADHRVSARKRRSVSCRPQGAEG